MCSWRSGFLWLSTWTKRTHSLLWKKLKPATINRHFYASGSKAVFIFYKYSGLSNVSASLFITSTDCFSVLVDVCALYLLCTIQKFSSDMCAPYLSQLSNPKVKFTPFRINKVGLTEVQYTVTVGTCVILQTKDVEEELNMAEVHFCKTALVSGNSNLWDFALHHQTHFVLQNSIF